MSTRSTAHFIQGERVVAIVYRHSDGYPSVAGRDILEFFEEVKRQTEDTRFSDPSYLAAKYVVFLAGIFSQLATYGRDALGNYGYRPDEAKPLKFISVGVTNRDPGDIEYRYLIHCDRFVDHRPEVIVQEIVGFDMDNPQGQAIGEIADVLKQEGA